MVKENTMKQTEIGLLPEDWTMFKIGGVINFSGGSQPPLYTFSLVKKTGYVRLIQIRDYKTEKYRVYIPENLGRKFCNKNDIMIGRYGPPVFQILRGLEGAYNVALLKAIPLENLINKNFAWHFLRDETLFNFVDKLSQRSSGQTGVDLEELRNYPIPLPSLSEQEVIAEALSDADTWIESLERLIAKKRLIKQGAMQQLLTPKGDWDVKKLRQIGMFFPTNSLSRDDLNYLNGDIFNIHYGDIHTSFKSHFKLKNEIVPFINEESISNKKFIKCQVGDLVIADASENETDIGKAIEICELNERTVVSGLHTIHFRPNTELFSNGFLGHLWQSEFIKEQILKEAQGTKVLGISVSRLKDLEIPIICLTEQTRIATILSDMDVELETLTTQLAKARQIKQGMMQELLTGRVRLV